ncbi:MAG: DMT family transporter [Hyphomicrobiaceae bacterium]
MSDRSLLRRAVVLAALAEGVLCLMDALIKTLTVRYPVLEIAFLRFVAGSVWAMIAFFAQAPEWPSRDTLRYNSLRSVLAVGAAGSFFYALSVLPMAEVMALSFIAPVFIAMFGVVLLKERFDPRLGFALAAGLVGMYIIVGGQFGARPYSADAWLGAAAVIVSSVFYALVIIILRARANRDPLPTIVLLQNVIPALVLAIPGLYVWTWITAADVLVFGLIGILGVGGHTLLAHAFRRAEAARLAPVHYMVLVWGTIYGWMFFGDVPGLTTLIGAAFIVGATLLMRR